MKRYERFVDFHVAYLTSGLAFIGHRFFQKNRPGVVHYPTWGTFENWVMTKDVLFGKLKW